jgi:hypothetical protein
MSDDVPAQYSPELTGDRPHLPTTGDEKAVLTAFLDWQRATFELKCTGVPAERLSDRGVPPSSLSLHGLIRHLASAERWAFRDQFAGEDVPILYYSDDDPDQDFESLAGDVGEALAVWRTERDLARAIIDRSDLDDTGVLRRTGEPVSLRYLMVKTIAEYARHNGHADLLRERIDGATGH